MLRTFVCALVGLMLVAGGGLAQDKAKKKKAHSFTGAIKKIDAKEGKLTVTVKTKKVENDMEFTIANDTKIVLGAGDSKKELVGKDGLKNELLKEGVVVTVTTDDTDKIAKQVQLGGTTKKKKQDK